MKEYIIVLLFIFVFLCSCGQYTYKDIFDYKENSYLVLFTDDSEESEKAQKSAREYLDKDSTYKVYEISLDVETNSDTIYREYTGEDGEGINKNFKVSNVVDANDLYIAKVPCLIKIDNKKPELVCENANQIDIYFQSLEKEYSFIKDEEIFSQKENHYLVYFMKNGCTYCDKAKERVMFYQELMNNSEFVNEYPLYIVNLDDGTNKSVIKRQYTGSSAQGPDKDYMVDGVTEWDKLYIPGTPSIIEVYEELDTLTGLYVSEGTSKTIASLNDYIRKSTIPEQEKVTYRLSYDVNGGVLPESYTKAFRDCNSLSLPVPSRENYIFVGWEENDRLITKYENKDYVLKARWIEDKGYEYIQDTEIFNQKESNYLVYFMKDGCTFCERIKKDVQIYLYKISTPQFASSTKLYVVNLKNAGVRSKILSSYTGEGGQGSDGDYFVDGVTNWEELRIPGTPTLIQVKSDGTTPTSTFIGVGSTKVNNEISKNLIENEKPVEVNQRYHISFDVNNESVNDIPDVEFFDWSIITLPKVTTEGYVFAGWYEGENHITSVEKRDYHLTAKWVQLKEYQTIDAENIYTQNESEYYVFFIEKSDDKTLDVVEKLSIYQSVQTALNLIPLYIVDLSNEASSKIKRTYNGDDGDGTLERFKTNGVTIWSDLYISMAPSMIKITTNEIKSSEFICSGVNSSLTILNENLE